jgi:predicted aspartyl protease
MLIRGEWFPCDDGTIRPVVRGEVLARDGSWAADLFLVDTGADCTVLSEAVLTALDLPRGPDTLRVAGLGGVASSVDVETQIRFPRDGGGFATFAGRFAAVLQPEALDYCILGRDITELFAVIVDRPGNDVALLSQRHRYTIESA